MSEPEFYAPWHYTKPYKRGSDYVIWDANHNPMAYSEDNHFLAEAIRRINVHDALLAACKAALFVLDWSEEDKEERTAWVGFSEFEAAVQRDGDEEDAEAAIELLRAAIAAATSTTKE